MAYLPMLVREDLAQEIQAQDKSGTFTATPTAPTTPEAMTLTRVATTAISPPGSCSSCPATTRISSVRLAGTTRPPTRPTRQPGNFGPVLDAGPLVVLLSGNQEQEV